MQKIQNKKDFNFKVNLNEEVEDEIMNGEYHKYDFIDSDSDIEVEDLDKIRE